MKKRNENIILLFIGIGIGALIGILTTPAKGSIIRSGLIYNLKSCREKLQNLISKLISNRNNITNHAKNMGKEVINEVLHSAEKILKELNTLTHQLENKN